MRFYFSGAGSFNSLQQDSNRSLGGNRSSSVVPNDMFNNLFGDVSYTSQQNQLTETKCVFLVNEIGNLSNLRLMLTSNLAETERFCDFEIAVVNTDGMKTEQIPNTQSTPYFGEFDSDLYDVETPIISLFPVDSSLVFWIRRKTRNSIQSLNEDVAQGELPFEATNLHLIWD